MMERKHILQSDNLAFPEFETARATLELFDWIERGTAIIRMPDKDGAVSIPPSGKVIYRALAGDCYDATLVHYFGDRAIIDVHVPGCAEPVRLSGIKVRNG